MKKLLTFLFAAFFAVPVFAACTSGQIDVTGNGSNCQTAHFSVGTTSTNTFKFTMSAIGTFYVDCGNGGTLTSDASDVTNNTTISRSGTTVATYTCTWGTSRAQTIRFGGTATGYSTNVANAAIAFYIFSVGTQAKISTISGNLSAMFPYKSGVSATGAQPRFYQTFYGATGLRSIPSTLFANYTTGASYMFYYTFYKCTGLTSLPANLFAKVTTSATSMFSGTFRETSITSIPENLFFPNATSVTGQKSMFSYTFYGCKGLTSIPANLFAKVTSAGQHMFSYTFSGCTGITGYIPKSTFAGLIANGSPTANYMWLDTFANTQLVSSCPSGTTTIDTTYKGTNQSSDYYVKWGNYAMCEGPSFTITTTSTNTFKFTMSAKGTFYVDCGNGGTLTSTANDVINNTITRSTTTVATYTCTWGTAGAQTIQFGGTATGYSTGTTTAAISFYISSGGTQANIASISGNLSTMFPYISGNAATGAQPRFYQTFYGATSLTSIPDTLFANYTMGATSMFSSTFSGCTGLTSIPENLFFPNATSVTGQGYMFQQTFYNCKGLTSIPANLFAKVTSGATYMFYQTFQNCTALTSIPENLFFPNATSVTGQSYMFYSTFSGCSGLTTIPANLFFPNATSVTGQSYMFSYTFSGCSGLTTIPTNLFAKITTSATYLFQGVFYNCGGLTSIPENLFFPNATSVSGQTYMFAYAFTSCGKLTSIPENLFANVTSGATYMFYSTFNNCTGLTSIPENLFFPNATSVTGQNNMFNNTFSSCTSLTYIPEKLFSKITSAASNLFYATFSGCTKITGYIPKSTFAGLIANGSPTANYMWQNTFTNTKLVSSCPSGTTTIDTTYKGTNQSSDYYVKWGNYAMCEGDAGLDCSAGYYLPANANACSICPINNICSGGTYTPGANNQGITACASGTFAPTGSTVCYPHLFHVGNDKIYMNSTKQTTPSLNFRIGNDVFFINMTTTRTKMNKDSDHYFHVDWGNNHYYVCDDTTCPQ